ncbi:hypothetical protein W911_14280 [Hyphomicrobium nitrativorans NL23]|uniref:Uncharacterized protein n=2 Tax=Hyphomicrobium TaxID=81 RepID=V5SFQ5_9HYPH|nr:hypothetical protein W911_14280 [Hyphomicrobium nitrativorans NL23]
MQALMRTVGEVCPIHGVSVGARSDKQTWRVDYADTATPEQIAAAEAAISAIDANAPIVPQSVTPYQARMALHYAGHLPAVEALVSNPETDAAARIAWEYATVFERHSPFIAALAPGLGLTEQQVDDLFIVAGSLT